MKTKKELKEEYKKIVHPKGVFKITNTANGKFFIGSSPNLDTKWNSQKMQLELNSHPNKMLQADFNKYGIENFKYEVVDTINLENYDAYKDYSEAIKELEKLYLDEFQPYNEKGYNIKINEK